jgi:diguanylate cyclase (GGDEF)-like protein
MALTRPGARVTTLRVVALAAVLTIAGGAAVVLERTGHATLEGYTDMPWWLLAMLFAVTDACVLPLRRGRTRAVVTFSEIPLVMGLFLADPLAVVGARLLGAVVAAALLYRRRPLSDSLFSLGLAVAGTGAALATFGVVLGDQAPDGPRGYLAAAAAAAAGSLPDVVAIVLVPAWSRERRRPLGVAGLALLAVLVPPVFALAGAAAVLGYGLGEAAPIAGLAGAIALVAYRTFAAIIDRHASLSRLYEFSDALADAPSSEDVIQSLLRQSADLLRAGSAEIMLTGPEDDVLVWALCRRGDGAAGPRPATPEQLALELPTDRLVLIRSGDGPDAAAFLAARHTTEALVAPLRIDDGVSGHVIVADRTSGDRGFVLGTDGRLLETVANHSSVTLRNIRLIERLKFEARHDSLTGLPNRLSFRSLLEEAAERADEQPFAVMVLDFDGFKAVNDTLGHQAGDELLRVLAGRFGANIGDDGVIARLGGDEFAVLAPGCADDVAARALAARVLKAFETPVEVDEGTRLRVGGSLGVALAPGHAATASDLLRHADLAMYAAKSGSGGVRIFSPDMADESLDTVRLAADLRDAVDADDFAVVVQPVIELETGLVHSVEVLARWHHPELGPIAPEEFFAAAERSNQTAALSMRILDHGLRAARDWHLKGHPVRVAVNLSGRWLADPSLPEQVGAALARHGVPADLLSLEITETAVIGDSRRTSGTLSRLRDLGVHLSVDDFGTGYSSLTQLSRLPVDQMKIDRSFVQRMYDSPRDRAVVRSIVDLGRNLGLDVVAEGVTAPGTRRALQEMGCKLAQGFLFAEPVPVEEVPRLIDMYGVVPRALPGPSTPLPRRPVQATVLPEPAWEITPLPSP